ncbi:MAG: DUF4476 domain-containing protein [Flavobacteriales bacterium]|nr:DUF4476 domain-containing protein [Flavobacteriales bacterium]
MKTTIALFIALLLQLSMVGQNYADLVVFTDNGKKFFLDVNGARQNNLAATNVKVTDLMHEYVKLRIQFEDAALGEISQGVMVSPNEETVYIVKLAKNGKYKLGFMSSAPRSGGNASSEQSTVIYNPAGVSAEPTTGDGTQTTTTTTTTSGGTMGERISIGIQTGKEKLGIDMQMPGDGAVETTQTTTTTTTSSASSSGAAVAPGRSGSISARVEGKKIILSDGRSLDWKYTKLHSMTGVEIEMKEPLNAIVSVSYDGKEAFSSDVPFMYAEKDWKRNNSYFKLEVKEENGVWWSVKLKHSSNYRILIDNMQGAGAVSAPSQPAATAVAVPASGSCSGPISSGNLSSAKNSINSKSFEDTKLTVAKQIIGANCFTAAQVKDLLGLFTYETSKLEIAKLCYKKTVDQGNYYMVNDAFTYSSSIDELNEYISGQGE